MVEASLRHVLNVLLKTVRLVTFPIVHNSMKAYFNHLYLSMHTSSLPKRSACSSFASNNRALRLYVHHGLTLAGGNVFTCSHKLLVTCYTSNRKTTSLYYFHQKLVLGYATKQSWFHERALLLFLLPTTSLSYMGFANLQPTGQKMKLSRFSKFANTTTYSDTHSFSSVCRLN